MPGSPYDGYTLHSQLEHVEILTGVTLADGGYRGVTPPDGTRLLISHTRGLPPALKKLLSIDAVRRNNSSQPSWMAARDTRRTMTASNPGSVCGGTQQSE